MSETLNTILQQIAKRAKLSKECVFIQLNRHISVELLRAAWKRIRKDGAPGVSGQTASEYAERLEENLEALYRKLREGTYRIPLIKRGWIPKDDGSLRKLGIPEFEDKIVQRAISMLLTAVYEQDFCDFSYGFRPKRSQHDAIRRIREESLAKKTRWVIDVDISKFFDTIDHGALMKVVQQRVNDGRILKLLAGWLKTGVVSGGVIENVDEGTPQGGVISPLLANIFLHEVLDTWFMREVLPRLRGKAWLVRYADDLVIGCEYEQDAKRIAEVLPKRMRRYGLQLNLEKTKLVHFSPPRGKDDHKGTGTFNFLGFTHYWAKTHAGRWTIKRKTAAKRLKRKYRELWQLCRGIRHEPIGEQYQKLCRTLRGWYQYHAVRCNLGVLYKVNRQAERAWHYWLNRRGGRRRNWVQFCALLKHLRFPKPRILHSTV